MKFGPDSDWAWEFIHILVLGLGSGENPDDGKCWSLTDGPGLSVKTLEMTDVDQNGKYL